MKIKSLISDINSGKYNTIFLIIVTLLLFHIYFTLNEKKVESMADVSNDQIAAAVRNYYLSDEFIRNISTVSAQLQKDGLIISGPISSGTISAQDNISATNKTNEGGRLRILNELKSGKAGQTSDWSIWNMTGAYGNKLSFWRYNGDGKNAGPALDLLDDGNVVIPGQLRIGSTLVTEDLLKRILPQQSYAGFAIDGDGTTMPLYEGQYNLVDGAQFDAWTSDRWDLVYINRGWRITLWHHRIGDAQAAVGENRTSNVPIKMGIPANTISSYKAEWIGY